MLATLGYQACLSWAGGIGKYPDCGAHMAYAKGGQIQETARPQ